jgi:methionyl-tRNA synthetase
MTKRKKFYITTAIDYPSGKAHAGHAYEKICADVLARWFRLYLGKENVFFQTGMDEHGLKIQRLAEKEKLKPQEYVDKMSKHFLELCEKYNISYDNFIRTTSKDHIKFCQEVLQEVYKKGDIYKGTYEGLYCVDCETYYTESELGDGINCPHHHKPCEHMKEESYFFRMSKYQKKVENYLAKGYAMPKHWNKFIMNRMNEGVRDLSISRSSFEWGIPLPFDDKQYTYVWFDALLNYLSGADKKFYPVDLHLIGHDILWHHSVIWLSMLMSAGYKLPKNVFVHGFINAEDGRKMSKSLGNVVDAMEIVKEFDVDSIRYFLIREIPFGNDGNFSKKALIARHNNELANDLGNLVRRTTIMIEKYFNGKIPEKTKDELLEELNLKKIEEYMENYEIHSALEEIWKFINVCNKYINDNKPWELAKDNKEELKVVIYNLAEALKMISILLKPFLPTTAEKIALQLGIKNELTLNDLEFGKLGQNKVPKSEILFEKIEEVEESKEEVEMVSFDDWKKMKFKIGKVVKAEPHPNADKLYVLKVDLGGEERQIVAGISKHYKVDELEGKKVVILTNLQPAKLRGIESNGMLLAAEDDKGNVKLLTVDGEIDEGAIVE